MAFSSTRILQYPMNRINVGRCRSLYELIYDTYRNRNDETDGRNVGRFKTCSLYTWLIKFLRMICDSYHIHLLIIYLIISEVTFIVFGTRCWTTRNIRISTHPENIKLLLILLTVFIDYLDFPWKAIMLNNQLRLLTDIQW